MPVNIAICDDERIEIEYLSELVRRWARERALDVELESYESAEQFLFCAEEDYPVNILLLDIQMKEIDGIQLARKIRSINEAVQIVFITGFADYMPLGYEVSALHYLIKPVAWQKLAEVLDRAVKLLDRTEESILLETSDGLVRVLKSELMYIEAFAHNTVVHTRQRDYNSRSGISQLEKQLSEPMFIRCHRSYIVGLRHVKRITRTELVLDNERTVPLSRRLYNEVNQAFICYYKRKE